MPARLFTKSFTEDDFTSWLEEVFEDDDLETFKATEAAEAEAAAAKAESSGAPPPPPPVLRRPLSGAEKATAEGERLCRLAHGTIEAFQVWTLHSAKRRVVGTEDI